MPPFTDWSSAATNIQAAVDASAAGDRVWVTNGVYATGGAAGPGGTLTNRVVVTKALLLQSVNGPTVTVIAGAASPGTTNGTRSIRCLWLGDGGTVSGFTLTQGATAQSLNADGSGGGAYCNSAGAVLTNCMITGNAAYFNGGGVFQGTVNACVISNNFSRNGAGVYNAWLSDSQIGGNHASVAGGGVYCSSNGILVARSMVWGNSAVMTGGGAYQGTLTNCNLENNQLPLSGQGGGVYAGLLQNCIVRSNTAGLGGGVYDSVVVGSAVVGNFGGGFYASSPAAGRLLNCTVTGNPYGGAQGGSAVNSILYYNGTLQEQTANYIGTTLTNCCTEPLLMRNLADGVPGAPLLMSDGIHLQIGSPCIGAGSGAYASGVDLEGRAWAGSPAIGCIEWSHKPVLVGQPRVMPGVDPGQAQMVFELAGEQPYCWWTKDGVLIADDGHFGASHSNVLSIANFNISDAGAYQVVASNSFGMVTSAVVSVKVACVDASGLNPSAPYTNWASAATNLQDAIDASVTGAVILVTNGIYGTGGRLVAGDGTTNRVVLDKALTVLSVNGPGQTAIEGAWDANTNGPSSVRCVWIADGAALGGITLRNGSAALDGGGAWCAGTGLKPCLVGCVISNCSAGRYAGGMFQGRITSSDVSGNMAAGGAGLSWAVAENCTVTSNTAPSGAAAYQSHLSGCQVNGNTSVRAALGGGQAFSCVIETNNAAGVNGGVVWNSRIVGNAGGGAISALVVCSLFEGNANWGSATGTNLNCTFFGNATATMAATSTNCLFYLNGPNLNSPGTAAYCLVPPDQITAVPMDGSPWWLVPNLLSDGVHLAADSPAKGRGLDLKIRATDLDGHALAHPPSIGCEEFSSELRLIAQPRVIPGNGPGQAQMLFELAGEQPYCWWTKDGVLVADDGHFGASHSNVLSIANFNISDAGAYQVVASNSFGMVTSAVVNVKVACVDASGLNPSAPYGNWASAATNLQDAIDASLTGTVILVTNGIYRTGGRLVAGDGTTNRVVLDKALTVLSVNGPGQTAIEGAWDANTNGPSSVRCVWIADGAAIGGITLRNGSAALNGGGAWCASSFRALLVNCVITNCSAGSYGGGVFQGRLSDCILSGSIALTGGGAAMAFVEESLVLGNSAVNSAGLNGGIARRSRIFGNTAKQGGGFQGPGVLEGCVVALNQAAIGAGVYSAYAFHCTIVSNISTSSIVAGVDFSSVWNSIVYFNVAPASSQYGSSYENLGGSSTYYNVCYSPYRIRVNGITNNPELMDLAHCASSSPCRAAGLDLGTVGFADIDGAPWSQPPSIGCNEIINGQFSGPLSVQLSAWPEVAAGGVMPITALISGSASALQWDFGDGTIETNAGFSTAHTWSKPGDYLLKATVFNTDNPGGETSSASVRVVPVVNPAIGGLTFSNGVLSLQFTTQPGPSYSLLTSTNLGAQSDWQLLQTFYSTGQVISVSTPGPDPNRFYRLLIQ